MGFAALSVGGADAGVGTRDGPPLGITPPEQADSNDAANASDRSECFIAPAESDVVGFVKLPVAVTAFDVAHERPDIMAFNGICHRPTNHVAIRVFNQ